MYRDEPAYTSVYMDYNGPRRVRIRIGEDHQEEMSEQNEPTDTTQQLIDNIVEVDATTGQTNIKIPVASKETVASVFQLFGKLFGGMK